MHKSFWNICIHLIWLTPLSCPCDTFASFPRPPFPKQRHWLSAKLPPPPPPIKEHIHGLEEAPWRQNYPQIQELIWFWSKKYRIFFWKTPQKHHMGGWKTPYLHRYSLQRETVAKSRCFWLLGSWKVVRISLQMPGMFVEKVEENSIKLFESQKLKQFLNDLRVDVHWTCNFIGCYC